MIHDGSQLDEHLMKLHEHTAAQRAAAKASASVAHEELLAEREQSEPAGGAHGKPSATSP